MTFLSTRFRPFTTKGFVTLLFPAFLLLLLSTQSAEGKQLVFRPLSAGEVYRLLHNLGREDAIPEGRIVSQGIAAVSGFALGLTKGIGGSLLFDLLTSNLTALTGGNSGSSSSGGTTQEICFNSRKARSLEEAEEIAEAYIRSSSKIPKDRVRKSKVQRLIKINRRSKRTDNDNDLIEGRQATGTATATSPTTTTGTTNTTPGTVTGTTGATGGTTTGDNGGGTGTQTSETTETGGGGATNCIVIQKGR